MDVEGQTSSPPSRRALLLQIGGALVGATVIVGLFVLPAEFGIDPTGFGKLTGLSRLAAPQEVKVAAPAPGAGPLARTYPVAFRADEIEIPLDTIEAGSGKEEIEFKVKMKKGATLVYSWSVEGMNKPDEFYSDFHSQSDPTPKIQVMSHEARTGLGGNGALVAPFDGIHGWYLQNQSVTQVKVRLKLAGFYERMTPQEVRAAAEAAAAAESSKFGPAKSE
jgi:hypothetical protein